MRKAYLETNAICRAEDYGISGCDLRLRLEHNGLTPVVGLHVIYELARTFLNPKNTDTAIRLFRIVEELSPEYSEQPGALITQEVDRCLNNSDIAPFLDGADFNAAVDEVQKLSTGNFDDKARGFIEGRDSNFQREHEIIAKINIEEFRRNFLIMRIRTFEDVLSYYENDFSTLLIKIFNGKLSRAEALNILDVIDTLHTIQSRLRSEIYLLFIALVHGAVPNTDKVDDHRHIIEAAYCDVFITGDSQLINNANKINPNIEIMELNSLL